MFSLARQIVRHKVGFVAVAAFAVFVFTKESHVENARSSGPWGKQGEAAAAAAPKEQADGMVSGAVGKALDATGAYLGEATGVNPMEMKDETVESFSNTAEAMKQANER